MTRTVHIAGRGAVTGYGVGLSPLLDGVYAGRSVVQPRRRTADFAAPTTVAAEYPAAAYGDCVETSLPLWAGRTAAHEAFAEAGDGVDRSRMGLVLATTKADMSGIVGDPEGTGLASPMRLARQLHEQLELGGPVAALSCACASGVIAISSAARRIALGECDRMLVVAADALNQFIVAGFGGMGALDTDVCRPFDADRRGVSLGDGAAAVVLTAADRESIGVRIAGYAGANDACHTTGPDYEGLGVGLAAQRAVRHAGLALTDIDVVHLHGTGTRANDKSEAIGLGNVWDAHGATPPAFGTKAQTGHTLGAAGVVESLLLLATLERGGVPANHRLRESDCDPRLSLVREPHKLARARHGLKVASGFGGVQGAVVYST